MGRLRDPISPRIALRIALSLGFWFAVLAGVRIWPGGIHSSTRWLVLFVVWCFVVMPISMLLHELGHASAVVWLGKRQAQVSVGRGPWARVRIGQVDVRFSVLPTSANCGAVCWYEPAGISWRSLGWIALAGPAATFLQLAAVVLIGAASWGSGPMARNLIVLSAVWLIVTLIVSLQPRPMPEGNGRVVAGQRDGWVARQAFARDRGEALPPHMSTGTPAAAAVAAPELQPAAPGARPSVPLPRLLNWFAEDARSVVRSAVEQARALGHQHLGTEHLLLGLLTNPQSRPAQALSELGVDFDIARLEIQRLAGNGPVHAEKLVLTMSARRMLEYSQLEATKRRAAYVRSEEMLLALMTEWSGVAARVLEKHNATREAIREALEQRLDEAVGLG